MLKSYVTVATTGISRPVWDEIVAAILSEFSKTIILSPLYLHKKRTGNKICEAAAEPLRELVTSEFFNRGLPRRPSCTGSA